MRLPAEEDRLKRVGIGDWALVHLDAQGLDLEPIVRHGIENELGHGAREPEFEKLPLLVSVGATDSTKVRGLLRGLLNLTPKEHTIKESKHRDVAVSAYRWEAGAPLLRLFDAIPANAYALTWNKPLLERWIDGILDAPKAKPTDEVEVNTSLYLAPPGGKNVAAISAALEWETHKRALSAVAAWQALYSAGAVAPAMTAGEKADVARRLLGYVPASPDGTAFAFDAKLGQVKNERHGSLSRPVYHAALAAGSGVTELFSQVRSVRVDLRFREDGIHTTMTLDWAAARK
jgi:hypothetical protein